MRSRTCCSISSGEVHQWALDWLLQAKLVRERGWKCTATVVLNILLRAAARSISVSAACRDLANAPSDQAVMTALEEGLPKTLSVLERRLNEALTGQLPRRLRRRRWQVAIDWHLTPYYGHPYASRNEIYYGKPRQGTKQFHAYASACIIDHGERYTLALTWVRRHESTVTAAAALGGENPRIGPENQACFLGSGVFQRARRRISPTGKTSLLDAGDVSRTAFQEASPSNRAALDQAAGGRLVPAHDEEQESRSRGLGVRRLSQAQEPQGWQTGKAEAAVRRVARHRVSDRDSSALPQAVRHRNELSPIAAGADLHLHAPTPPAAVVYRARVGAPQPVGLGPPHAPGGRRPRQPHAPSRTTPLQTHAGLDRSCNTTLIA